MGFSIAGTSNAGSIMAELSLTQETNESEGTSSAEESADQEAEQSAPGSLRAEGKSYTFLLQKNSSLSEKCTDYLLNPNGLKKEKIFNQNKLSSPLTFKESTLKSKEFTLVTIKHTSHESKSGEKGESVVKKTQESAKRAFEKAELPKQTAALKVPATAYPVAKALEQRVHHELLQKKVQEREEESSVDRKEAKKETERTREQTQVKCALQDPELVEKKQCEEQGFQEQERQKEREQEDEDESCANKGVEKIDRAFESEFKNYAMQESILSEIFNMKISQFDVLILFIEILKLEITSREQEKLARREEREMQILHMQKVVENYKSQSSWLMTASLGAGILAIVSGICPIVGHLKGKDILQKLSSVITKFQDMNKDQFFKMASKITFAMSEMYKSTGQIQTTFAEGSRTYDQHKSDLHRTNWDENTRSIDEIKDSWKGIENFLYQMLQMNHEAIRQLYAH